VSSRVVARCRPCSRIAVAGWSDVANARVEQSKGAKFVDKRRRGNKDPSTERSGGRQKLMKRTVMVVAYALLLASAPVARADHSAGGYRWPESAGPISVLDNMTPHWDPHLMDASRSWEKSRVLAIAPVSGSDAPSDREQCKAERGVVAVCNSTYGKTRWLGLTTVVTKGSKIVKARVRLNDTYFDEESLGDDAMRKVVCHELGHAFGLGHQEGEYGPSCMEDARVFDRAYVTPNDHDYEQLEALYADEGRTTARRGSKRRRHHHRVGTSRDGERTRFTFLTPAPVA
jgi:hypothetical protein